MATPLKGAEHKMATPWKGAEHKLSAQRRLSMWRHQGRRAAMKHGAEDEGGSKSKEEGSTCGG